MANNEREKTWIKIVPAVIVGGASVLAAMLPLYCSSQKRLELVTQTADNETDSLRKQLTHLESQVQKCEEEKAALVSQPVETPRDLAPDPVTSSTEVTSHDFRFNLKECKQLRDSTVRCEFIVTNLMGDRELSLDEGRIIDDAGNEYPDEGFELGAQSGNFARMILPGSVPVKGAITFASVRPGTKLLEILEMTGYNWPASGGRDTIVAKFLKVPL